MTLFHEVIARAVAASVLAAAMCCSAGAQSAANPADPLPRAKPEEVGMSSARLADIAAMLKADIARGDMPGAVLAVARHGKLVYFEAFGYRDKVAGAPMTTDAIFNIASMTKPLVAVAALQLYEQGKLLMDEPLAKYFPKVRRHAGRGDECRQGYHHRQGAGGAQDHHPGPVPPHRRVLAMAGAAPPRSTSFIRKAADRPRSPIRARSSLTVSASLPLHFQPGSTWDYGFGSIFSRLVVEQQTEQTIGAYLRTTCSSRSGWSIPGS